MKIKEAELEIILDSINRIEEYIGKMSFDDFLDDYKTFDAIVTQLMHLGETTRKLVETFGEQNNLPTQEMIGMRNFIAHEYLGINEKIIYETIKYDIPKIKILIKKDLEK